ncbi:MAG: TonB-dependent receptor [Pseudomonadota bacterium]
MSKQIQRLLVSSLAMATALSAAAAQSSSQNEGDPEQDSDLLIVTAQKREQSVLEVPISLKAYGAETIEALQIDSIQDVSLLTPSVAINDGINPNFVQLTIRGIGNIGGEQQTTGIYVDGFELSANSNAGLATRYDDIERIEVLRGPQGTTFGRNVVAGAISITTKDIGDEVSGYAEARVQNFGGLGVRGTIEAPLLGDTLGMRFSGYAETSDGNIKNVGPSGGRNSSDRFGGRVTTVWNAGERFSAKLNLSYDTIEQDLPNLVTDGFIDADLLALQAIAESGQIPALPNGLPLGDPSQRFPNRNDRVNFDAPANFSYDTFVSTLNMSYDFGAFELVSITGGVFTDFDRIEDTDLSPLDSITVEQRSETSFASTEWRLQSTGDQRFDWTVGLYAANATNDSFFAANSGSQTEDIYFIPPNVPIEVLPDFFLTFSEGFSVLPNNVVLDSSEGSSDERFYAAFAEGDLQLTDTWAVFGGLRFNHDRTNEKAAGRVNIVSVNTFADPDTDIVPNQPLPPEIAAAVGNPILGSAVSFPGRLSPTAQEADFEKVTWRVGTRWVPIPELNFYGLVSAGYRPGGLQNTGNPETNTFGSETLTNYEVGLKSNLLDGRLRTDLALFFMDWQDVQINTRVVGQTISFTQNVGEVDVYGVEFDSVFDIIPYVTFGLGFAYLDTEIIEFSDSSGFDRAGSPLPNVAEFSGNIFLEGTLPVGASADLFGRVAALHNGEQLADFLTGGFDRPALDSFQRVDLRFGYRQDNGLFVEAYAENLLDAIYATGKNSVGFGLTGQYVTSPPRVLGLRVRKDF